MTIPDVLKIPASTAATISFRNDDPGRNGHAVHVLDLAYMLTVGAMTADSFDDAVTLPNARLHAALAAGNPGILAENAMLDRWRGIIVVDGDGTEIRSPWYDRMRRNRDETKNWSVAHGYRALFAVYDHTPLVEIPLAFLRGATSRLHVMMALRFGGWAAGRAPWGWATDRDGRFRIPVGKAGDRGDLQALVEVLDMPRSLSPAQIVSTLAKPAKKMTKLWGRKVSVRAEQASRGPITAILVDVGPAVESAKPAARSRAPSQPKPEPVAPVVQLPVPAPVAPETQGMKVSAKFLAMRAEKQRRWDEAVAANAARKLVPLG